MKVIISVEVEQFFNDLTEKEVAKVLHTLELLEMFGHELGLPHSRHMGDGLLELRISGKRTVRILYFFNKQTAFLLHAFIKKTQQTPKKDIRIARERMTRL